MSILITGSNGLLGQKIVRQLVKSGFNFIATSKGENRNPNCPDTAYFSLDITNPSEIEVLLNQENISSIINTAAMTNVDACEDDEYNCRKLNVDAVGYLLAAAKSRGIFLTHVSTDFVFDGENGPYAEDAPRNPLSIYATSKRDSEDLLMNSEYDNWAILRTIIVFGQGNNLSRSNIVLWGRDSLKNGTKLTIVDDQYRAPTWADDLAWACIKTSVIQQKGVFHISGPETFSIYELLCRIADYYGYDKSLISPIKSNTLNQKAKRPPKTGFILDKAKEFLGYNPLTLEQSLSKLDD
jgi:dTDP-4-dehydrorhamnose reductase